MLILEYLGDPAKANEAVQILAKTSQSGLKVYVC